MPTDGMPADGYPNGDGYPDDGMPVDGYPDGDGYPYDPESASVMIRTPIQTPKIALNK